MSQQQANSSQRRSSTPPPPASQQQTPSRAFGRVLTNNTNNSSGGGGSLAAALDSAKAATAGRATAHGPVVRAFTPPPMPLPPLHRLAGTVGSASTPPPPTRQTWLLPGRAGSMAPATSTTIARERVTELSNADAQYSGGGLTRPSAAVSPADRYLLKAASTTPQSEVRKRHRLEEGLGLTPAAGLSPDSGLGLGYGYGGHGGGGGASGHFMTPISSRLLFPDSFGGGLGMGPMAVNNAAAAAAGPHRPQAFDLLPPPRLCAAASDTLARLLQEAELDSANGNEESLEDVSPILALDASGLRAAYERLSLGGDSGNEEGAPDLSAFLCPESLRLFQHACADALP